MRGRTEPRTEHAGPCSGPSTEAKGKKKVRFVYLTDNALAITRKLMLKHPEGRLFRLSPQSVNCRFVRLRHKIGRAVMEQKGIVVDDKAITKFAATLSRKKAVNGKTVEKTEVERHSEARRKLMDKEASKHAPSSRRLGHGRWRSPLSATFRPR